jgi:hypothetical protein
MALLKSGQLASGRTYELQSELLTVGIPLLAIGLMWSQAGRLRLFSKWSESRIGWRLVEDSALRRALFSHR